MQPEANRRATAVMAEFRQAETLAQAGAALRQLWSETSPHRIYPAGTEPALLAALERLSERDAAVELLKRLRDVGLMHSLGWIATCLGRYYSPGDQRSAVERLLADAGWPGAAERGLPPLPPEALFQAARELVLDVSAPPKDAWVVVWLASQALGRRGALWELCQDYRQAPSLETPSQDGYGPYIEVLTRLGLKV